MAESGFQAGSKRAERGRVLPRAAAALNRKRRRVAVLPKAVVLPQITAFGGKYLITLKAIDANNQKLIARQQEEARSKNKVIAALGKAASQLRKRLGESLSSLENHNAPLDLATTSSLEALQAYTKGEALPDIPLLRQAKAEYQKLTTARNISASASGK